MMREQWACPDLGVTKPDGMHLPIPGSPTAFDECPAYFLRTAGSDKPARHLIDETAHPGALVSAWAFEVEVGARLVDSLPPKGIEGVHLWFGEKRARDDYASELRKSKRAS